MSAPPAPHDHAARVAAATEFNFNIVVTAGAGTGKTSLLVERVLNAIGSGRVTLAAIAAITFTEKAAGELRQRLATGLDELAALAKGTPLADPSIEARRAFAYLRGMGVPAETIAARSAEATSRLDRAVVSTIHGFCSDILRAYPLDAGLPPGFTVERGARAQRAAQAEWASFIAEELGPSGRGAQLWERVLSAVSLADASAIAIALASGGIPDEVLAGDIRPLDLHRVMGPAARRLAEEIRRANEAIEGVTAGSRRWLEDVAAALVVFADDGPAAVRRHLEHPKPVHAKLPDFYTKDVGEADADALTALGKRAISLLRPLVKLDEAAEVDVFAATATFARRLRAKQSRAGVTDFDALLVKTRNLLRDTLPVREEIKHRFAMILLDEFQDTDPIQYEIVFFAAEPPGDSNRDAYATRLAPGKLFIVGDAKQSIYRFRGADYTAYRRAVARVLEQGGVELCLTSNFRSLPGVIGPINRLFESPRSPSWRESSYQPPYEPIQPEREMKDAPAVELWTADAGSKPLADDRRKAEAKALAAELASIAGPGRSTRYADVLVLFRSFTNITRYLRALREAGVPFVVSGGRTFAERTEIVQAMAVLRSVADPDDEASLLGYLRSPAGGVSDRELATHAASRGAWRTDAVVDAHACKTLAAALSRLAALREEVATIPVDAAVRRVLDRSGLLVLSGLAFESAQRVANLEKLALAASELARDGRLSLAETLDSIEDGPEFGEEGDSPLADETTNAVRVMTIHAAKGLEAKVVVLADAAADRGHPPERKWKVRMTSAASEPYVRLDGPAMTNAAAVFASLDEPSHEKAEDVRVLYVALTRACDRLIVIGGESRSSPWIEALSAWGYDPKSAPADGARIGNGEVLHRLLLAPPRSTGTGTPSPVGAPEAVARYEAAVAAVARLAAPEFRSPSRVEDRSIGLRDGGEDALRPELAREVGTIVHARLAGVPAAAAGGEAANEAEALLAAFERSPLAAQLRSLDIVAREVPMLFDDGAARWRGVIDLIYRDADGTLVIADYKTDASSEGAVERHGAQLGVYVQALKRAMPNARVRAELWMLRSGTVLAV